MARPAPSATGDREGAAVAANRIGDVAVAWEDDRDSTGPADDTHSEIYLRLFRSGTSAYEVTLSPGGTAGKNWKHVAPDVGLDDRGNAVVVWSDDPDGNGTYTVAYRVVSPAGTVTASGHANASSAGQQLAPRVAVDPDGAPKSTTAGAVTVVWGDAGLAAGVATGRTPDAELTAAEPGVAAADPDVALPVHPAKPTTPHAPARMATLQTTGRTPRPARPPGRPAAPAARGRGAPALRRGRGDRAGPCRSRQGVGRSVAGGRRAVGHPVGGWLEAARLQRCGDARGTRRSP